MKGVLPSDVAHEMGVESNAIANETMVGTTIGWCESCGVDGQVFYEDRPIPEGRMHECEKCFERRLGFKPWRAFRAPDDIFDMDEF